MAHIRKVGVLGAGVMGSGIAAHVAGAGVQVVLLDIVPPNLKPEELKDKAARNRFAQGGKDKALTSKPESFFSARDAALVEVGNLDDDLDKLKDCDWIVEVVKEDLAVKQALFAKIEKYRAPHAVVSSNTSGLPLAQLTEGRDEGFRRHFLITHFFNPVRYMKLLEFVVGPDTHHAVVEQMHRFGEEILGKGIVYAKDTPNFIANRIGVFGFMDAMHTMVAMDLSIEEVDAIQGKPMGHPKSAIFRTGDMVGLDTLLHVAENCKQLLVNDEDRAIFEAPAFIKEMVKRGMLGDKSGGGFYKKTKEGVLALDWKTLEYKPAQKIRFESTKAVKEIEEPGERIKTLLQQTDKGAEYAWKCASRTLNYSAKRLGEIADDVVNIDRGMKWGFNWELGPFETLDAVGIRDTVARMEKDGLKVAPILKDMAAKEAKFYPSDASFLDVKAGNKVKPIPVSPRALFLPRKDESKKVKSNDSATLWDIGDGVFCVEFHSKMNSVDGDIIAMLNEGVETAERDGVGLVLGNESKDAFSAGANLFLILMAAREKQWDQIEKISKDFQDANMRLRYSHVPVVSAPFGLALGGGAEMAMSADAIRAHAELYMGLVEVGVGVVPAGGGCKELVFRAMANIPDNVDPFLPLQKAFETVAMAKVSMSAEKARDMLFLRECDQVTLSREQLLRDAKESVLGLARSGYKRPTPRFVRVPGETGIANFKVALWSMMQSHFISEHDMKIATHVARIFSGGNVAYGTRVGEQQILDLEREAFLSLCGEEKTQARIEYMLMNNKPLRN